MSNALQLFLIDDDDAARTALAESLRLDGFVVAEASHCAAALELLQGGLRFDAILLDLAMPVAPGTAAQRRPIAGTDAAAGRALRQMVG